MKIVREQKGFTLVEILIALGITALVAGTLGTAIFQIFDRSARGNDTLKALNDIHNAGRWLYLDGERAETTDLVDATPPVPPVNAMSLSWTSDGQLHTATYSLSGTELVRNHNGTVTTVARYVSSVDFSISNRLIKIDLTSTPGSTGVSKQVTYHSWLRPTD